MKRLLGLVAGLAFAASAHVGAAAPVNTSNGEFSIEYLGQTTSGSLVTFSWEVCKLNPAPQGKGLSHCSFELDFSNCLPNVCLEDLVVGGTVTDHGGTPVAATLVFGTDPTTGVTGVKFDGLDLDDSAGACYLFTLTLDASLLPAGYHFGEGTVMFATKAGPQDVRGSLSPGFVGVTGPVCEHTQVHEGLSPGFWKNHPAMWTAPYHGDMTLGAAGFSGSLYQSSTMMQALNFGGGSGVAGAQRILFRAAVAALLNAADSDIDYPLTIAQVLSDVNAALATGSRDTMLALAEILDGHNNLGLHD